MTYPLWLGIADAVLAAVSIGLVIARRRGVYGTLTWIFAILAFPFLGALAYLALAHPLVARARRRKLWTASQVHAALEPLYRGRGCDLPEGSVLELVARLTDVPATAGNTVDLYTENQAAFAAKNAAVAAARRSVWAEYYIVQADDTGNEFLDRLIERARAGLDVRLLYDAVGSSRIDRRRLAELVRAGGRHAAFRPIQPFRRPWAAHLRNHRKLLVLDGLVAFTGGMNIGNEYSGYRLRKRRLPWRDAHVRIEGPAAADAERLFAEDWAFATGERPPVEVPRLPETGGSIVALVPSGPDQEENASALAWFAAIAGARRSCYLSSPYFLPDEATQRALQTAALRGVDVRVLVPEHSDVPLVGSAGWTFFPPLLEAGVRIFQYQPAVLHAKTLVVDGERLVVGSANVDMRSFAFNFELGALVEDDATAGDLERRFLADLAASEELSLLGCASRPWRARLRSSLARLLAPLL